MPANASSTQAEADITRALAETSRLQMQAADPRASVWVSANAGTGKTHVLTQRVLRLLLSGTPPERILCLTYTKAAAAEMSKRVFDTLAGWVGLDEPALTLALTKLLGATPTASEAALARTLFTRAIETPGGFKVQTIHAFCERLLQLFPLEAGVAPGFKILDDHTTRTLITQAINDMLMEATRDRGCALGQALTTTIRYAADDQFDQLLTDTIKKRDLLAALRRRPMTSSADDDPSSVSDDPFAFAQTLLRQTLSVRPFATADGIRSELANVLDPATLKRVSDALNGGTKTDVQSAIGLADAARLTGQLRIDALARFFLTKEREVRKSLMTKAVREANPALDEKALSAQQRFVALDQELKALDVIAATLALYRLGDAVLMAYQQAKAARAALDFDDLIVKTASLLSQEADAAAWVLYKLDGGLDHILVDEAQDTAPAQWRVIQQIATEFFADRGAGSRTGERTVFAVGDEKQSIYSFQGAAPEMFAEAGARFEQLAEGVGMAWRSTALTLSFRTVAPILTAVDHVFADVIRTPGVARADQPPIQHAVKRLGQSGLVEIWPTEKPEPRQDTDAWSPLQEPSRSSPVTRLAERIAATIKGWIDTHEMLVSEGRPIRAGDILILVRKREPFASTIVAALKAIKVPVAGADRMKLTGQIAVQDLIALGDFLTLPEDDLSLAAVLKSPLFGLDDDQLLSLAHGRKNTLWRALLDAGEVSAEFAIAANLLKRWRKEADFLPPFEFYAGVLDHDGRRLKLLERLGPESADGIDEFLNLALTYDDQAPPSLTGFLDWLRSDDRQIKRDMEQGRDEVRVLTVHGSKGLEAPIVFLPDTCTTASGRPSNALLALLAGDLPSGVPALAVWPIKGSQALPAIASAKAAVKLAETRELNRLLYVAITRPRDRLYVAGFQSRDKLTAGCWYDIIETALAPHLTKVELADGTTVMRLEATQTAPLEAKARHAAVAGAPSPRPPWMEQMAPREPLASIPVAPSRLAPYDFDENGEPVAHAVPTKDAPAHPQEQVLAQPLASGDNRFLRGTLTHALLQHLPELPAETWKVAAGAFLDRRAAKLSHGARATIVVETLAILHNPTFAALFGPSSQAEVPIVAELANPSGKGPALRLHGQIDRLVVTPTQVLIVDYKTNRPPPIQLVDVADAYLMQLAAYRLALCAIFPDKSVHAALLWTQTPSLMEIPTSTLMDYGSRLWDFGTSKLDVIGLPS